MKKIFLVPLLLAGCNNQIPVDCPVEFSCTKGEFPNESLGIQEGQEEFYPKFDLDEDGEITILDFSLWTKICE